MSKRRRPPTPVSEAHARLGEALRRTREEAGVRNRQVPKEQPGEFYSTSHISLVEAGATAPSRELIDSYARIGGNGAELRSLHQQAQAATREAGRARRQRSTAVTARPPREFAEVTHRDDVQQHYVVVSYDAHYTFRTTGAIRDVACKVMLRANAPGVRLYYSGFTYPTDQRPGVLSVEPVSGIAAVDTRESTSGAVGAYFLLDNDVAPQDAEAYELSFRVVVRSDARSAPWLRYFAGTGNQQLSLRADFPRSVDPILTWWFAAADVIDAEQPPPGHQFVRAGSGSYERVFDPLIPGWCYGFAWIW